MPRLAYEPFGKMNKENPMGEKIKIIATIGPSSQSKPVLKRMIESGMSVARLNFSHGNYEDHKKVINTIRSLSEKMRKPVAILADLQGPKIRTEGLKNGKPVRLKQNGKIGITCKKIVNTEELISTTYSGFVRDVIKGATIFLDDGLIELKVIEKARDTVTCTIVKGGILKENKGINMPGVNVSAPSLTEKDMKDLRFGIQSGVDFFALSFVRSAGDLKHFKTVLKREGSDDGKNCR